MTTRTATRTSTGPSNDQIMEVLGVLGHTSTQMLCDRLRNVFAGRAWDDFGTPAPTLHEMEEAVYEVNKANGWFDDERSFGTDIALLHSEVSEMFEAYRDHGFADATRLPSDGAPIKPEGFGSEAADVLVRWLDTTKRNDYALSWATLADVEEHSDFDTVGEPEAVGDHIAKLHALITNLETDLELALQYLKTWCDRLGIDLQLEFDRKLAFNATRGHKHGGKLL